MSFRTPVPKARSFAARYGRKEKGSEEGGGGSLVVCSPCPLFFALLSASVCVRRVLCVLTVFSGFLLVFLSLPLAPSSSSHLEDEIDHEGGGGGASKGLDDRLEEGGGRRKEETSTYDAQERDFRRKRN